jgi:hypothetical protein
MAEKRMIKRRKLLGEPAPQQITIKPTQAPVGAPGTSAPSAAAVVPSEQAATKAEVTSASSSANGTPTRAAVEEFSTPNTRSTPGSGANTPSKASPGMCESTSADTQASGKKKKGKK